MKQRKLEQLSITSHDHSKLAYSCLVFRPLYSRYVSLLILPCVTLRLGGTLLWVANCGQPFNIHGQFELEASLRRLFSPSLSLSFGFLLQLFLCKFPLYHHCFSSVWVIDLLVTTSKASSSFLEPDLSESKCSIPLLIFHAFYRRRLALVFWGLS